MRTEMNYDGFSDDILKTSVARPNFIIYFALKKKKKAGEVPYSSPSHTRESFLLKGE